MMNDDILEAIKKQAKILTASQRKQGYQAEALHLYTDMEGEVIYCRLRMKHPATGDKWIRPLSRNAAGVWCELKEPPFPNGKPLYQLHKLAASPNATVLLVEGEKCAECLDKLNIVATTSGAADSARLACWQSLAGRDVVIWPDNDPAGLKYAKEATAKLIAIGCKVQWVDIAALDLPHKGDCVDWLKSYQKQHGREATAADVWALPVIAGARENVEAVEAIESVLSPSIASDDVIPLAGNTAQADSHAQQSDDEIIRWLASLKPVEYDKVRTAQAKVLGIRPATLDGEVKAIRTDESEADRLPFAEVEPHPDPIHPAQLLNELSNTIRQFIVLDSEQADAAALWVALTHFIDVVEVAPLAIINAPEKACGKTQLLTVLGRMSYRPLPASNASASALFRAVELWKPTILIDEADTFFRDNAELHGMVNAGYLRDGYVLRSEPVGDSFEPRMFSVFSAKALAGIALEKHLPDATMSRGIVLNLRRKLPHESVSRLRHADRGLFIGIAEKLARFGIDYAQQVRQARPLLPDALSDRDQDNWDGLLAIASCAGDEWFARAIAAALKLSGGGEKTVSTGNELLSDIQHVFESKKLDKISTADLIAALITDDEKSWATYNRGKPISGKQIATRLSGYDIRSKTIRLGYEVFRGFELSQFNDAFARYLSGRTVFSVTPLQTSNDAAVNVTDGKKVTVTHASSVTREAAPLLGCNTVTNKHSSLEGTESLRSNASHLRI